jgi:hypothetical protein
MKRDILLPGKLLVTWFVSGAVLSGGALVSYGLFEESLNHFMLIETVGALYIIGGVLGFLFAGAVGMLGRPSGMGAREAFQDQLTGALYILPVSAVGFVATGWIALSYWSVYSVHYAGLLLATVSWLGLALVLALAVEYGWLGARNFAGRLGRLRHLRMHISFHEQDPVEFGPPASRGPSTDRPTDAEGVTAMEG